MHRTRLAAVLLGLTSLAGASLAVSAADAAPVADAPTVLSSKVIGRSVQGRAIRAYRLGDPTSPVKAVVLGSIHGDETAGIRVTEGIRRGQPVHEVDLWVIPTVNPDGVARGTRQNVHGVDLNRNFPYHWGRLTGKYYSGPRALSEPESRALKAFLDKVRPRFMVSFHQPLNGVGSDRKDKAFQQRLSRGLRLPVRAFNCSGVCYGTMTSWYNHKHRGTAITVEFGYHPSVPWLRGSGARATVRAVLGQYLDQL
jgi:predicted deacylase